MLTQENFIKRIKQPNSPSWLHVGVDTQNENQLYIAVNGGMNNINCAPIETYLAEIKVCALVMIDEGELFLDKNPKPLRIAQGRSAYFYTLKTIEHSMKNYRFSFANLFVKWQITHDVSDISAQDMLGLTTDEFCQFKKDELDISDILIDKLHQSTGFSKQLWLNCLAKHKKLGHK
jgi:hypothetical protein